MAISTDRPLTNLEKITLILVSEGKTNKEIARERGCSHHSVNDRLQNIYFKMGVHNRSQAISKGFRQGILHCNTASIAIALILFSQLIQDMDAQRIRSHKKTPNRIQINRTIRTSENLI